MPVRHWGNHADGGERGIWDTLNLGGKRMPGIATVELKLPTGIVKRKARGKQKAGLKDEGTSVRELRITLVLETKEDLELADALRDFICGRANGDPSDPLDITHEAANYFGVDTVVLGDVDIDNPDPVQGWVWKLQAFEWWPEDGQPNVKDQRKRPVDDTAAWLPYRDDGTAGGIALPSDADAAHGNLPDPRAP